MPAQVGLPWILNPEDPVSRPLELKPPRSFEDPPRPRYAGGRPHPRKKISLPDYPLQGTESGASAILIRVNPPCGGARPRTPRARIFSFRNPATAFQDPATWAYDRWLNIVGLPWLI